MTYWQHEKPLSCPLGHRMYWLGSIYWICPREHCHKVYAQLPESEFAVQNGENND